MGQHWCACVASFQSSCSRALWVNKMNSGGWNFWKKELLLLFSARAGERVSSTLIHMQGNSCRKRCKDDDVPISISYQYRRQLVSADNVELRDSTVIYPKRWDGAENTSTPPKGSNPAVSGAKLLLSSWRICHNWHIKQGRVCHKLTGAARKKIATNFTHPKTNIKTMFCEWT